MSADQQHFFTDSQKMDESFFFFALGKVYTHVNLTQNVPFIIQDSQSNLRMGLKQTNNFRSVILFSHHTAL